MSLSIVLGIAWPLADSALERAGNVVEVIMWIGGFFLAFLMLAAIVAAYERAAEYMITENPAAGGSVFVTGLILLLIGYIFGVAVLMGVGGLAVVLIVALFIHEEI